MHEDRTSIEQTTAEQVAQHFADFIAPCEMPMAMIVSALVA